MRGGPPTPIIFTRYKTKKENIVLSSKEFKRFFFKIRVMIKCSDRSAPLVSFLAT